MAETIIGVMGPGAKPTDKDLNDAYELGRLIAGHKWVLLTGGRKAGVMDAASRGASENGGLVVGVLPGSDRSGMSQFVDIPVLTGMGGARNNINVLSSDIVIACGSGAGTTSEIMLALKAGKAVIMLNQTEQGRNFFQSLDYSTLHFAESPQQAVDLAQNLIS